MTTQLKHVFQRLYNIILFSTCKRDEKNIKFFIHLIVIQAKDHKDNCLIVVPAKNSLMPKLVE